MADVLIVANPYEGERLRRRLAAAGHAAVCSDGSAARNESQTERSGARLVVLAPPLARGDAQAVLASARARALPVVWIGEGESGEATVRLERPLDAGALLRAVRDLLAPGAAAAASPALRAEAEPEPSPPRETPPGGEPTVETAPTDGPLGGERTVVGTAAWPVARTTAVWVPAAIDPPTDLATAHTPPPVAGHTPPPRPLALAGSLAETDVATLLARLYREGFTGQVRLIHGEAHKTLSLDGGFVVAAASNLPVDRMSEHLLRGGRLTRAQIEECEAMLAESGRKTGAILVERGYLKESEWLPSVRRHSQEIAYSVFGWDSGEYQATPGEIPAETVRLGQHPAALIVEGIRRRGEPTRLLASLGGLRATLRPTGREDLLRACGLTEKEWAAAALMDGRRSLADVARRGGLSEGEVARLAWALLVLAIVRQPTTAVDAPGENWELPPDETDIDRGRVAARHALVREGDYFEILGVPHDATAMDVKRAHERARAHFDVAALPAEVAAPMHRELEEIALVLDEALRVLSDDTRRDAYRRAIEFS